MRSPRTNADAATHWWNSITAGPSPARMSADFSILIADLKTGIALGCASTISTLAICSRCSATNTIGPGDLKNSLDVFLTLALAQSDTSPQNACNLF